MPKDNRVGIKAAKLTLVGTVLAAFIAGAFLLINTFVSSDNFAPNSSESIHAGRDVIAGRDIVVKIQKHPYLDKMYLKDGVLRQGWFGFEPPQEALDAQEEDLTIFPIGLANHRLGFLVSSQKDAHCKVEQIYLKLRSFAPCSLRNEYTTIKAYMGVMTSAFHISEDYDIYPIYPLNENLTKTSWRYQGRDVDEFRVYLSFKNYVLYLISINIDYIDLNTNQKKHLESDEFALIDVARVNTGGCLNVESWFKNDMRLQPTSKRYDEGIPHDVYQLLTADFDANPGLINLFMSNQNLVRRKDEVENIVKSRPNNRIFSKNFEAWVEAISAM